MTQLRAKGEVSPVTGQCGSQHQARVLIVDDSPTQLVQLKSILEPEGFEVQVARDGASAFECFVDQSFRLVLADVLMPGMSGYELCRRIKSHKKGRNVSVALITGLKELKDLIEGLQSGADDFITKPIDPSNLLERVRSMLNCELPELDECDVVADNAVTLGQRLAYHREEAKLSYLVSIFDRFVRDKRLEQEKILLQAQEQRKLVKLHEDFLAKLTHDLKNPLIGAQAIYKVLLDGKVGELQAEQLKLISVLNDSNRALLEMVHNFLDCHRLETGQYKFSPQTSDLVSLVKSCLQEVEELSRANGLSIQLQTEQETINVCADRIALRRVVGNLVGNSIRYTSDGGLISIVLNQDSDTVSLVVADNGPGIPNERLKTLFDRFRPLDEQHTYTESTGLGLFICQEIVRAHHGTISYSKRNGGGSKITVVLPKQFETAQNYS